MKLFENYLSGISDIISKYQVGYEHSYDLRKLPTYFKKGSVNDLTESLEVNSTNKVLIEFNNDQLTLLFGNNPSSFSCITIGSHPDFSDIGYQEYENHYCVTMFTDIKGSTQLNEKYSLLEIRKIKDTVLTLAIHVALNFGGHIHRLQGDGIVIQFVRKNLKEQDAVINSLNTASVLTHFVTTDLSSIFESNGVKPLRIRTGIDFGLSNDVIWSHYGIPGCTELTTTSLHTDLASKLQSRASSNGILVGGNIKDILDIKPDFCKDFKLEDGSTEYYIYQGSKNYRMFDFDWRLFLRSFDFIKLDSSGKLLEIDIPTLRIQCTICDENDQNEIRYFQNSRAIPKKWKIKYTLYENDHLYHKKDFETIEWLAHNSGKEAKDANELEHDFRKQYNNTTTCLTSAAYKGHHYVECIIKRSHSYNKRIRFPIFVE